MSCRFIVMSDTHFSAPPTNNAGTWWNKTTEHFSERMGEALIACVKKLSPDFAIHCGDFVGVCSRESFAFGAAVMDRLGCPWYVVPGNHDTWCSGPRDMIKEMFGTGENGCSYMKDIEGIRFFFLDVAQWYNQDGSVSSILDRNAFDSGQIIGMGPSENDLNWLEEQIKITNIPSVMVCHAPVAYRKEYPAATLPHGRPVRGPLTEPAEFIPDIIGHDRLLRIAQKYHVIKACFAGHWHINDVVCDSGVWHIMTVALREFPYEIRLVEFKDNNFRISTHRLDVPELIEISYVKEWGNRWIEGEDEVRFVTCSLR